MSDKVKPIINPVVGFDVDNRRRSVIHLEPENNTIKKDFNSIMSDKLPFCTWIKENTKFYNYSIVTIGILYCLTPILIPQFSYLLTFILMPLLSLTGIYMSLCFFDWNIFKKLLTVFDYIFLLIQINTFIVLSILYDKQTFDSITYGFWILTNLSSSLVYMSIITSVDCAKMPKYIKVIVWCMVLGYTIIERIKYDSKDSYIVADICIQYYDCTTPVAILKNLRNSIIVLMCKYLYSILRHKDRLIFIKENIRIQYT